jgi:hypothetical protein
MGSSQEKRNKQGRIEDATNRGFVPRGDPPQWRESRVLNLVDLARRSAQSWPKILTLARKNGVKELSLSSSVLSFLEGLTDPKIDPSAFVRYAIEGSRAETPLPGGRRKRTKGTFGGSSSGRACSDSLKDNPDQWDKIRSLLVLLSSQQPSLCAELLSIMISDGRINAGPGHVLHFAAPAIKRVRQDLYETMSEPIALLGRGYPSSSTAVEAGSQGDRVGSSGLGREFPRWYNVGLLEQVYAARHGVFEASQHLTVGKAATLHQAEQTILFRRLGEVEDPSLADKIWHKDIGNNLEAIDSPVTLQLASWLPIYALPSFSSALLSRLVDDPCSVLQAIHTNKPELFDWMASKCEGPGTVTCYGDVYTKQVSLKKWGLPIIAARSMGIDVRLSESSRSKLWRHIHQNRHFFGTNDCALVAGKLIQVALL